MVPSPRTGAPQGPDAILNGTKPYTKRGVPTPCGYVSGDAVDLMAEVRKELRAAYQLAKECQTEEPKEAEERCTKSYT